MTIVEIAKTHNGRKFRRKGQRNWYEFLPTSLGVCKLSDGLLFEDTIRADDWEFESEPMSKQRAGKIVLQAACLHLHNLQARQPPDNPAQTELAEAITMLYAERTQIRMAQEESKQ